MKTMSADQSAFRKRQLGDLAAMKARGEKIAVVTAYDAPSARLAEAAGVECLLVGDSAAMTVLGHDSTVSITMDEMLMLTRAVVRGARVPIVVADMPFGSFQVSDRKAVEQGIRFIKQGGADAVKVEGAGRTLSRVRALVAAGIPVMGHIGLTPQSASMLGGYKPQGRTADQADRLIEDARALAEAGCFAIVLEAIPGPIASYITAGSAIPTIGIGAGPSCDGQVLVWHDVLGITPGHVPQFVRQYADIGNEILGALAKYVSDVRAGAFPEPKHTYSMPETEFARFASRHHRQP
jgi:3-methyl-2-oxobutanoate hydroxymethyltransferase